MKKSVAIIHYNTPKLTEATILSLRKQGVDWPVVVFDNSDELPFTKKMKGVKVINNRKQQLVNFNEELLKHQDKCEELSYNGNFASVKHMMSVQYVMDNVLPEGFILLDSDVLLKRDISYLWDETYAAAGRIRWYHGRRIEADRLLPYVCYINAPMLKESGIKFFDPDRCWGLHSWSKYDRQNLYDTGASLLEDIVKSKPKVWCRNWQFLEEDFVHFGAASYSHSNKEHQQNWLEAHADLWR